jgi:Domain of unknown function (DUF4145)
MLHTLNIPWEDNDSRVDGADNWSTLQCAGCHTVTFVHSHWFSEEYEIREQGAGPVIHRDLFPPAPVRPAPEWARNLVIYLTLDELWIAWLLQEIYSAVGLGALSLAAMGTRAIVDHLVTSRAGDTGTFTKKLQRLEQQKLITEVQVQILEAAFEAGSATAHRGYRPTAEDLNILLDITETLIHQLCVNPSAAADQAKAAKKLSGRTPARQRKK